MSIQCPIGCGEAVDSQDLQVRAKFKKICFFGLVCANRSLYSYIMFLNVLECQCCALMGVNKAFEGHNCQNMRRIASNSRN